ncbi:hypothetical protein [Moraxella lacunata]|uniref:hypothetical protein n=1 Tax=Moraxella lacunata TaxID=477 RepID=UPI003EE1B0B2
MSPCSLKSLPKCAVSHANKILTANANKANSTNCPNVGLTQLKARTDPTNIHKAATILAAKFRENLGKDCIFRDCSDKWRLFIRYKTKS